MLSRERFLFLLINISFFFYASISFAQKNESIPLDLKEFLYGDIGHDKLHSLIEGNDGSIWAIGESEKIKGEDGINAYLMKLDKEGKRIFEPIRIEGRGNLKGKAICEDEFGDTYVVCENEFKNKNGDKKYSIWLNKYDFEGNNIWKKELSVSSFKITINNLIYDQREKILTLAGLEGQSIWFTQFDIDGNEFSEKKYFSKTAYQGFPPKSLSFQKIDNYFYLFGIFDNLDRNTLGIIKLNNKGVVIGGEATFFPNFHAQSVGNIIALNQDKLAIIGTTDEKRNRIFYISIDKSLNKKTSQTTFLRNELQDIGTDILVVDSSKIYVAGSTIPGRRADNERFLLLQLTADGVIIGEKIFGDKYENIPKKLLLKRDGSLWLGGIKNDASIFTSNYDFYFAKLIDKQPIKTNRTAINYSDLSFAKAQFSSKGQTTVITENSETFIQLIVQNKSNQDLSNLLVSGKCVDCTAGLLINPTYFIDNLPAGTSKLIAYPIKTTFNILDKKNKINFSLKTNTQIIKEIEVAIQTVKEEPFKLISHKFISSNREQHAIKGKKGELLLLFENKGLKEVTSAEIGLELKNDEEIFFTKGSQFFLEKSINGSIDSLFIPIEIGLAHAKENFTVSGYIKDKDSDSFHRFSITEKVVEAQERPTPKPILPVVDKEEAQFMELSWDRNNTPKQLKYVNEEQYEIIIHLYTKGVDIKEENFKITIIHENGDSTIKKNVIGKKADQVPINIEQEEGVTPSLVALVNLKAGLNKINVAYEDENIRTKTNLAHEVIFQPKKLGILYLFSVGIPYSKEAATNTGYSQLEYSKKDAEKFASLFKNQKGLFYDSVHSVVLTLPEETTKLEIRRRLSEIVDDYAYQITEKDALIAFFSAHGKMNGKEAVIIDSQIGTYSETEDLYISLDEIYEKLRGLRCQSFVFVDACRSDDAFGDKMEKRIEGKKGKIEKYSYAKALNNRLNALAGVRSFTSCSDGEESHELPKYGHGLFTKAIIDILSDKTRCKALDQNKDFGLSISEIYEEVKNNVKLMLRTNKKFRNDTQTPEYKFFDLKDDPPLFVY